MADPMRRFAWLLVVAGLLAGCAPTMATLPPTATAADRRQAERCHARALEEMERGPSVLTEYHQRTGEGLPTSETGLAIAVVAAVTAPIWYPIAKAKKDQRLYDDALARCRAASVADDGEPPIEKEPTR